MTDFGSFIENTRTHNSSPILMPYLYHILDGGFKDPFLVRIPPAIFSVLSVAVLLALPRAGVSYSVAALSAFILAIAPFQIEYGQEVREYSLSVFVSCLIVLAFASAVTSPRQRSVYLFSIVLFAAPFASYGTIFMAFATAVAFLLIAYSEDLYRRATMVLPAACLSIGVAFTYQLTAKYQMDVAQASYLAAYYPPGDMLGVLWWLTKWTLTYVGQAIGQWQIAPLALLVMFLYMVNSAVHRTRWLRKHYLYLALAILIVSSIAAAAFRAYPFGGIRQHLFATPLVVVCAAQAAIWLGATFRKNGVALAMLVSALLVSLVSLPHLPRVYAEKEDVISAVTEGLAGVADDNVYVYYAAVPAVNFHYPERKFVRGAPGDIESMGNDVVELTQNCDVAVLFSHMQGDEPNEMIGFLEASGLQLVEDHEYRGARVIKLSRCAD